MNPILIPIIMNREPEKCPNCKNIEDTVVVCNHCNYKYPESDLPDWVKVIYVVGFVITLIAIPYFMMKSNFCYSNCNFVDAAFILLLSFAGAFLWPLTLLVGILFLIIK